MAFPPIANKARPLALPIECREHFFTLRNGDLIHVPLYHQDWCLNSINVKNRTIAQVSSNIPPGRVSHSSLASFRPNDTFAVLIHIQIFLGSSGSPKNTVIADQIRRTG